MLAINFWDEDKEVLATFVKDKKLRQRVLLNGSAVGRESYGIQGLPVVFWVDRNGIIVDGQSDSAGPGSLEKKSKELLGRSG